jgi:hypothetical protein
LHTTKERDILFSGQGVGLFDLGNVHGERLLAKDGLSVFDAFLNLRKVMGSWTADNDSIYLVRVVLQNITQVGSGLATSLLLRSNSHFGSLLISTTRVLF